MPEPNTNETKDEFMSRCVPELMKGYQGEEPLKQDHAVAKCNGIYQQWMKRKKQRARNG